MTYPRLFSIVSVTLAFLWSSVFGSVVSPQVSIAANGANQQLSWPLPDAKTGLIAVQATGSFGGGSLQFYGSLDSGETYYAVGSAMTGIGSQTFNWRDGQLYYTLSGATAPAIKLTFFGATAAPAGAGGGGGGGATGSVTAAGVNGTAAQAVQGINGGIPFAVVNNDVTSSGSITGSTSLAVSTVGRNTVAFQVTGTWTGTIQVECTVNGTDWIGTTYTAIPSGNSASSFTANNGGQINCTGVNQVRLRGATIASGTANIAYVTSSGVSNVMIDNPLPTGSNVIGAINNISGTISLPTGAATSALQSTINTTLGTPMQQTGGSVTANLGTLNGAALATGQSTVLAASTAAAQANTAQVVALRDTAMVQTPIVAGPPSAQSIAAAGTFQFAVQGGTVVALTLTNAPAATATWVATVGFQWSADGSVWNALSATPRSTLPGASAVQVTQTTTVGLWLATLPANAQYVRYNVSAWTSGTIWGFVEPWQQANGVIQLPWTPTVTSGQTVSGWIDASGINSLLLRVSAITTTQLQFQGTNDPSGTDADNILAADAKSTTTVPSTAMTTAQTWRAILSGHKWIRVQVTTTGTVCTIQGLSATLGPILAVSAAGNSVNAQANIQQIASVAAIAAQPNGVVTRALGVVLGTAVSNTDQNAVAFAGSGRVNGTIVASGAGGGVSICSDLNITVTTLGTATALVPVLAVSSDASTIFTDVWTGTPITASTRVRVPAIPVEGRRRWSLMSVGGTSTTVPATITTQELPAVYPLQRQFVDIYAATNPTASIIAGTSYPSTLVSTTLNSTSGVAVVEGCKIITLSGVFTGGTPTTAPVYTLQVSDDPAGPWFSTATTMSPTAAGAFRATAANVSARFARIIVSTASSGGTPYGVTYTAIYGIN